MIYFCIDQLVTISTATIPFTQIYDDGAYFNAGCLVSDWYWRSLFFILVPIIILLEIQLFVCCNAVIFRMLYMINDILRFISVSAVK